MCRAGDHYGECFVARMKVCPDCKHANESFRDLCEKCGFDLLTVEVIEEVEAPVAPTSAQRDATSTAPQHAHGTRRDEPESARTFLVFPWGDEGVVDTLLIGREGDSSLQTGRIERSDGSSVLRRHDGFGWVSGRHAELFMEDGVLHIRDLGSTNGTFVNGRRIGAEPTALSGGDEVAFSQRIVARVRLS